MTLKARILRLEAVQAPQAPLMMVFVDVGQTEEEALAARFGDGERPENVMFIRFVAPRCREWPER